MLHESKRYPTAELTELGSRLLGLTSWHDSDTDADTEAAIATATATAIGTATASAIGTSETAGGQSGDPSCAASV